ncbi:integrase catalytic domain-containing protein, partial [Trichonephila inaurata madagascariensis]
MDHLLGNSTGRFDDETPKLIHSFYVDNCVTGVNDIKEQENFIVKAIEVMIRGCFNLRDWESSVPGRYIFRSSGAISLLGLLRDLDKDTLKCNRNYSQDCKLSKYIMWLWRVSFTQWPLNTINYKLSYWNASFTPNIKGDILGRKRQKGGRRKIVRNCIRCKQYKFKSPETEPVSLPSDSVNDAAVFRRAFVKGVQKTWIAFFPGAIYSAVQLELTSPLSTDAFLLSLRRFIIRKR